MSTVAVAEPTAAPFLLPDSRGGLQRLDRTSINLSVAKLEPGRTANVHLIAEEIDNSALQRAVVYPDAYSTPIPQKETYTLYEAIINKADGAIEREDLELLSQFARSYWFTRLENFWDDDIGKSWVANMVYDNEEGLPVDNDGKLIREFLIPTLGPFVGVKDMLETQLERPTDDLLSYELLAEILTFTEDATLTSSQKFTHAMQDRIARSVDPTGTKTAIEAICAVFETTLLQILETVMSSEYAPYLSGQSSPEALLKICKEVHSFWHVFSPTSLEGLTIELEDAAFLISDPTQYRQQKRFALELLFQDQSLSTEQLNQLIYTPRRALLQFINQSIVSSIAVVNNQLRRQGIMPVQKALVRNLYPGLPISLPIGSTLEEIYQTQQNERISFVAADLKGIYRGWLSAIKGDNQNQVSWNEVQLLSQITQNVLFRTNNIDALNLLFNTQAHDHILEELFQYSSDSKTITIRDLSKFIRATISNEDTLRMRFAVDLDINTIKDMEGLIESAVEFFEKYGITIVGVKNYSEYDSETKVWAGVNLLCTADLSSIPSKSEIGGNKFKLGKVLVEVQILPSAILKRLKDEHQRYMLNENTREFRLHGMDLLIKVDDYRLRAGELLLLYVQKFDKRNKGSLFTYYMNPDIERGVNFLMGQVEESNDLIIDQSVFHRLDRQTFAFAKTSTVYSYIRALQHFRVKEAREFLYEVLLEEYKTHTAVLNAVFSAMYHGYTPYSDHPFLHIFTQSTTIGQEQAKMKALKNILRLAISDPELKTNLTFQELDKINSMEACCKVFLKQLFFGKTSISSEKLIELCRTRLQPDNI